MNPHKTIEKLKLGDTVNRLLSVLINTDTIDTNLYIGTIDIVYGGEPCLNQLPWIPRKVENLQGLTSELHNTAIGFNRIATLATDIEQSKQKIFPQIIMQSEFSSSCFSIKEQIEHIKLVLMDMENAVKSIECPSNYFVNNLYRISASGSNQIINEHSRVEYPNRVLTFTGAFLESPMHYFLVSVSDADNTAFVSRGYRMAPLVGAGYHEIWGNIHTNPRIVNSQCVWRS